MATALSVLLLCNFSWRATDPATLVWAEALDGGDWNVNVLARDKILFEKAPFDSPAVEIARTEQLLPASLGANNRAWLF
jgi:hypothetical protein